MSRKFNMGDAPHFPPQARRVIHVFSPGGVSQVDTFDHKPELARLDGQPLTGKGALDTFFGRPGNLRKSYYKFARHGACGGSPEHEQPGPHL